jgi:hypothetical protein
MQTYARQGGTSAIFVHDDGLQLISEAEREKRITFYSDHNIGWVARPKHSDEPDGFKRAGRFKKASNMNYGLQVGTHSCNSFPGLTRGVAFSTYGEAHSRPRNLAGWCR